MPLGTSPAPKARRIRPGRDKSGKTLSMSPEYKGISPRTEDENRGNVSRPQSYSFPCMAQILPLALWSF